jgi:hypothetical protein
MKALIHIQDRKCGTHTEMRAWCRDCNHSVCVGCHLCDEFRGHEVKLFEQIRESSEKTLKQLTKNAETVLKTTEENISSLEKSIKAMEEVFNQSFWFDLIILNITDL